jgi:hypothetical protein
MVGEFGCDENDQVDQIVRKPKFLSGSLEAIAADPRIKAFVYFDINKDEGGAPKEWAIESPESRKAYAEAIGKYKALFVRDIQTTTGTVEYKAPTISINAPVKKTTGGKPLYGLVSNPGQCGFNGANGNVAEASIILCAKDAKDPGLSVEFKSPLKGHLVFTYKGTVLDDFGGNSFTIIFYKQGPSGDWTKDVQLKQELITPSNIAQETSVNIPQGTDKINIMLVGKGNMNIELTNVRITE